MTDTQAKAACCDPLYASTAACGAAVSCPAGWSNKGGASATLVNGLVVGGLDAVNLCCDQVRGGAVD
jgi:hypothetical protein